MIAGRRTEASGGVRLRALIIACALIAAACGAPQEPLKVGMREVSSNIVLGGGDDAPVVPPAPVPPTAVDVTLPQPTDVTPPEQPDATQAPPPAPSQPQDPAPTPTDDSEPEPEPDRPDIRPTEEPEPTPPPPPACELADPRDPPASEARRDEITPPVEATYEFRNNGGFESAGIDASQGTFDDPTERRVTDVRLGDNGDFEYSVVAELGGTTTTTTYLIRGGPFVPGSGDVADQAKVPDGRGLYIKSIETEASDGLPSTFAPKPELLLLPVPATSGTAVDVTGTDPASGTTMSYHLTVVGKQRVAACGANLDAIRVTLTDGRLHGPRSNVDFTATYDLGTQFGGLMLRDTFVTAGREGLNTISRNNVATINDVPEVRSEP